ncbi:nucleotidyltransferase [Hominifimenecus sp. rT4P-3]|uniref:nucleotidyltransferase n=1 Tax=Hominifimenecus sp. rT4P-3 TaxID=3242979 RepID=UPI003DA1DB97
MKKPVLVVMAAGMGSRFGGGIKQLSSVGPSGELIIDYSVYDAKEAGFETVIFIIRKDIEADFRERIGCRIEKYMDVKYVYQDIQDLPAGFCCPKDRTKPWGTGHAVLACRKILDAPFAVINADDYYGKKAFRDLYQFLSKPQNDKTKHHHLAMAGFVLGNTLSENGTVTRGVCLLDENGKLKGIEETKEIGKRPDGTAHGFYQGKEKQLDPSSLVSMNFWGFPVEFIPRLEKGFVDFLKHIPEGDVKGEYLLPILVDQMLMADEAEVTVLPTTDIWFGMTYQEDQALVAKRMDEMVKQGNYPTPLFPEI